MPVGKSRTAARLQAGLTLVPYGAYNERGVWAWYCRWVELRPGESISQAAARLSKPPVRPQGPANKPAEVPFAGTNLI